MNKLLGARVACHYKLETLQSQFAGERFPPDGCVSAMVCHIHVMLACVVAVGARKPGSTPDSCEESLNYWEGVYNEALLATPEHLNQTRYCFSSSQDCVFLPRLSDYSPYQPAISKAVDIMWRKISRREKPPPAYEESQSSQGPYGDPNANYGNGRYAQGPEYYQTGPGPWQQGGYYQQGAPQGYYGQSMYGPGPFPAGQRPYPAQGTPYGPGPYGPGAHPRRGYYPQQREAKTGIFGAVLAALACCCCLDLLI